MAIDKRVADLDNACSEVEQALQEEPLVDVALVGRSRHGKSTLINSLAGEEILETSAVRPCSAAIVKLLYSDAWSVEITFVTKDALREDRQNAVKDAAGCLDGQAELSADESKYFKDTLERFIELFGIDKDLSNREKLDQVRSAELPKDLDRLLDQTPPAKDVPVEVLRKVVSKHLSTETNYWTIVDRCVIRGPFKNWHQSLGVVDLPGTNDTNAHRSLITERVRSETNAVGIVTQESNLGDDIESWLRESRVLADFIESVDNGRQHLFIIRTQLDNFVPQIDEEDEEREDELIQAAIENYKLEQTATFHEMFKDIVQPVIDAGLSGGIGDAAVMRVKRQEMHQLAEQQGIGEIYADVMFAMDKVFNRVEFRKAAVGCALDNNRPLVVMSLDLKGSGAEQGIQARVMVDRLARYCGFNSEDIAKVLPAEATKRFFDRDDAGHQYQFVIRDVNELGQFCELLTSHVPTAVRE